MPDMSSRGSLESNSAQFPASYDSLMAKCKPEIQLYKGAAATDVYSAPIYVGNTTGFSLYVKGSGTCTLQVSPTPQEDLWCVLADSSFTSATNGIARAWLGPYSWVRVKIDSGSNMQVYMYRKYMIN